MAPTFQEKTESVASHSDAPVSVPAANAKLESWQELIEVPRWAVYFQAALLGLIATTFFIFGLMVGNLTSSSDAETNAKFECRVFGSVAYRVDGDLRADDGAVIMLLPHDKKPEVRSPGELVNPDSFKALENDAIARIQSLGGAVVRADENGQFDVVIDAKQGNGLEYYLLIVSKNQRGVDIKEMTKEEFASIGTYFSPVEDLVEDRSFFWMKIVAESNRLDLPEIEF